MTEPLLRVADLKKHYPVTRGVFGRVVGQVQAVDGVSFDVGVGETLGLVGESGCGKTTVGRSVIRLIDPTSGSVTFDGKDVTRASRRELDHLRRNMQIVFQDPMSSLNPRLRVVDIVGEALEVHGLAEGADVEKRVAELLRKVGLPASWINRYPHEFSGGQRQRIGIARAIALEPKLVVCDEAVSALDVSIQAQVLNLLIQLRRDLGLAYLFIAHDLSVVRHVSHRIAVMYLGKVVELGPAARLFEAPAHPYTRALLSAIPVPVPGRERRRVVLQGDVPSPLNPPAGCRFHTRCPAVMDRCRVEIPEAVTVEDGHSVACFHAEGLAGDPDWFRQESSRIERRQAEVRAASPAATTGVDALALPSRPEPSVSTPVTGDTAKARTPFGAPGLAVAGLAAVAVLAGHAFVGVALGAGAYFGFVRPRVPSRRNADVAFALLVVLAFVAGVVLERRASARRAEKDLSRLARELQDRAKLGGAYPAHLSDLGWRLYPLFERGEPLDPWGRLYRYRTPGTDGRPFDLGSTGRDGLPSADDLGHVPGATDAESPPPAR